MERCYWKSISIDVGDKCLLEDSHGLFSHNGNQLILEDELESPIEGRRDYTRYMQPGPPSKHIVWRINFNHLEVYHEASWANLNH